VHSQSFPEPDNARAHQNVWRRCGWWQHQGIGSTPERCGIEISNNQISSLDLMRDSVVIEELLISIDQDLVDRVEKGQLERHAARSLIERMRLLIDAGECAVC
jgi:hypothetical protein